MKRFVLNSTVAAMALISASSAFANDYNTGVVTKGPSEGYTDVEFGSGWYIRGDITYNIRGTSESTLTTIQTPSDSFSVQADYDDAVGARIGAGYYISPNFRIEGNVEGIANSTFNGLRSRGFGGSRDVLINIQTLAAQDAVPGTAAIPGTPNIINILTGQTTPGTPGVPGVAGIPAQPPVFEDFPDTITFDSNGNVTSSTNGVYVSNIGNTASTINGTEEIDAEYSAASFIVSGYYDLPKLGKFTPYVGAGIGYGRINYSENRTFTCVADDSESCGFPAGQQGETVTTELQRNEEFWAFAYQISAGTSYRLNDNLSVDVGYSYTDFAGGDDLSYDDGTAIDDDGFAVHQVRAGVRYDLY